MVIMQRVVSIAEFITDRNKLEPVSMEEKLHSILNDMLPNMRLNIQIVHHPFT